MSEQHLFKMCFSTQQSIDFFAGLINYADGMKPSGKEPRHWQHKKKGKSRSHQAFVSNDRNFTPCR